MAISFVNKGTNSTGTSTITLNYPASITAGNLLLGVIASKYPSNYPTIPAGWTQLTNSPSDGGSGSAGADSGQASATAFYKIADGTETGTVVVTITGGNTSAGNILQFSKASGTWGLDSLAGAISAGTTSLSATAPSNQSLSNTQMEVVLFACNGNLATFSAHALSAPGITTWTSQANRFNTASGNGDDCAIVVTSHVPTDGPATGAVTWTATASASTADAPAGGLLFIKLYEASASDDLTGANLATTAPVLGQPTLSQTQVITGANLTPGGITMGQPDLGQTHILTSSDVVSGIPVYFGLTLGQTHSLLGSSSSTGQPVFETPSLSSTDSMLGSDLVASQPVLGQPDLRQTHILTALHSTTGAPTFGIPTLGQTQVLVPGSVQSGQVIIELPDLGQTHNLIAEELATSSVVVGSPTLFIGIIEVPFERTYKFEANLPTPQFEIREIEIRENRVFRFPPRLIGG